MFIHEIATWINFLVSQCHNNFMKDLLDVDPIVAMKVYLKLTRLGTLLCPDDGV